MKKNKFLAGLAAVSLVSALMSLTAAPAFAGNHDGDETGHTPVSICHATPPDTAAQGWAPPPQGQEVDSNSVVTNAHNTEHELDIIEPVPSVGFAGKNWTETFYDDDGNPWTGEEILENGCAFPVLPDPDVATADVSFTDATCVAGEKLTLGALSNASWEPGATDLEGPLSYDFDALADENAEFAGGSMTKNFTGSLDGPLDENDPACVDPQPELATASVSFTQPNCFSGEKLILGTPVNASWEPGATDLEGPLSYDFDALADENAEFAGGSTTKNFTGSLDGPLDENDPACVLGLVMPKVTSTPITCSANGSYTLGVAEGYDPTHVTWTVNGTPGVVSGTYLVTTSQIITVSAQAVAPNGLEPEWVDPTPLGFIAPDAADCLQLTTLAYTGSSAGTDNNTGLLVAGGLMFFGALGMVTRRRIVGARAE